MTQQKDIDRLENSISALFSKSEELALNQKELQVNLEHIRNSMHDLRSKLQSISNGHTMKNKAKITRQQKIILALVGVILFIVFGKESPDMSMLFTQLIGALL